MKRIITAICVTAMLAALTACNNETAPDSNISSTVPESTNSTDSAPESSDSTPESSDSAPESSESVPEEEFSEPSLEELIGMFTLDELPLPDGTVIKKTEATEGLGGEGDSILKFNVAVMRYCKPVFQSSYGDPECFDWDNYEFFEPIEEPEEDRIVTVREGDVLENGMTVKSVYTLFEVQFGELYYKWSGIELEGEQTLEGILYCREEDDYGAFAGDVELYVDTTKCENVPMRYDQYGLSVWTYTFPEHKVALTIDGTYYDLGNIDECKVDLSGVFSDSPFAKVKVTIKNPILKITESATPQVRAELVDIDVIG